MRNISITDPVRAARFPRSVKDITGMRFGDLVVERQSTESAAKHQGVLWECKCVNCGSIRTYDGHTLRKPKGSRSCGCRRLEAASQTVAHAHAWKGYGEISATLWRKTQFAKDRPHKNNLPIEYGWQLFLDQSRRCALTGLLLTMGPYYKQGTASLDRIDSSKGYEIGNVQWVHKDVNRMKNSFDQDYFVEMCRHIAEANPRSSEVE